MELKPIDTIYDGYKFRSRLEARWAVFFDAMGIKFEYEPQGYELPSGKLYLPDFKLFEFYGRGPCVFESPKELWCEVKGVDDWRDLRDRKKEDEKKVEEFSGVKWWDGGSSVERSILILPNIPKSVRAWWESEVTVFSYVDGDSDWPCIITRPENIYTGFCLCGPDGDSLPDPDQINVTEYCLSIARQARFEHGQTPRVVKV